jgi:putative hydrolase of the HAD superfamily
MRAVLLDALGTLVELERPWPHLVAELDARGVAVTEPDARRAMLAEMAYYRANHDDASDRAGLADLRRRCAQVVRAELGVEVGVGDVEAAMLAAIRFRPYPEVPGVLAALRDRGVARVVVSNWDVSLHDVLERTRLRPLVDAVVTSAEFGAAKPDPAIFMHALELAGGVAPGDAVHAGDDVAADVEGARAAGIAPIFVARDGEAAPPGVRTVPTLEGLLAGEDGRVPSVRRR